MIESLTAVWPGLLALSDMVPGAATAPAAPLWSVASLISLATLASLEIVLGIDNVIFIAILSGRLPKEQQPKARQLGIALARDLAAGAAAGDLVGDGADAARCSSCGGTASRASS